MEEQDKTIEDLQDLYEDGKVEDTAGDIDGDKGFDDSVSESDEGEIEEEQSEGDGTEGEGEGEEEGSETEDPNDERSGIERYLEKHGIKNGVIKYDDGEEVNFNELNSEEQFNILQSLQEESVNLQEYLNEDEIGFISYLRENDMSIDDLILSEAERLSKEYSSNGSIEQMSDDEIYLKALKDQVPDLTDEDLEEELKLAKDGKNYDKKVQALREEYINREKLEKEKLDRQAQAAIEEERRQQEELIINSARSIENFNGFEVTNDMKNEALGYLIETEENNNSRFVNLMQDPDNLFKASLYMLYGDSMMDSLHEYYQNEITKARERGKEEAMKGLSKSPVNKSTNVRREIKETPKLKTIEDLHNE